MHRWSLAASSAWGQPKLLPGAQLRQGQQGLTGGDDAGQSRGQEDNARVRRGGNNPQLQLIRGVQRGERECLGNDAAGKQRGGWDSQSGRRTLGRAHHSQLPVLQCRIAAQGAGRTHLSGSWNTSVSPSEVPVWLPWKDSCTAVPFWVVPSVANSWAE